MVLTAAGHMPYSVRELLMVALDVDYEGARALVERTPVVVARGLSPEAALRLVGQLEQLGASAERALSKSPRTTAANELVRYQVRMQRPGANELAVMIVLRDHAGCSLSEARERVDQAPGVVARGLELFVAERLHDRLRFEGAEVKVEREAVAVDEPDELEIELEDDDAIELEVEELEVEAAPVHLQVRLSSPGARKIQVIKALRSVVQTSLKEAKRLVDTAPSIVAHELDAEGAQLVLDALVSAGASASIEASTQTPPAPPPAPVAASTPTSAPTSASTSAPASESAPRVILEAYGARKILVIKEVRSALGVGLREAKRLVDTAPTVLGSGLDLGAAELLRSRLVEAGASVRLEGYTTPATSSQSAVEPEVAGSRLFLESYGARKIQVIKVVRSFAGLGLKAVKDLVESAPCVVAEGITRTEAERRREQLEAAGARARVEDEPPMSPGGPTQGVEEEEEEADHRLRLESYGRKKINVIKVVRRITGQGLKAVKELVESAPCVVAEGLTQTEAERHKAVLEGVGASASVERDSESPQPLDDTLVRLCLDSWGRKKIHVIKVVKSRMGLGLKDTKQLVESAPCVLQEELPRHEAQSFLDELEGVGASARIEVRGVKPTRGERSRTVKLVLTDWGQRKIQVIKVVRQLTGLSLKQTKQLVESAPCEILGGLRPGEVAGYAQKLLNVGAKVSIERE